MKEILLKIEEWGKYLLGQWKIILAVGLIGAALGLVYALLQKSRYEAQLSFVLEESKSSPLGAYAGLASQFLDLSGSSSGLFSGDNIIEFLKSRFIIEKTFLSPSGSGPQAPSIADLFIEKQQLRKAWNSNPSLKEIHFPVATDRSKLTIVQDSVLNELYKIMINTNLTVAKLDKKLSFIIVKCITSDQYLSKIFVERLVEETSAFYIATKTKRSQDNVDNLQAKADSVEKLLNLKTYSAAQSQDVNQNPAKRIAMVGTELDTRDKMMLQTIYVEIVKNLQITKMSMAQETPIIQVVDTPILPLEKKKLGKTKGILSGGVIGGFLILIFLIFRRLYKQIMA